MSVCDIIPTVSAVGIRRATLHLHLNIGGVKRPCSEMLFGDAVVELLCSPLW